MRSILVQTDRSSTRDIRLQTALDIARRFDGHVTAQINTPIARLIAMDSFGGVYPMTEAIAQVQLDASALATEIETQLARDDVPFTVERNECEPLEGLSHSARLADLVVMELDSTKGSGRPQTSLVGAVTIAGGAPVLALVCGQPVNLDGTAMIAWSDSREAAVAIRAAVPLLKLAAQVRVVRIGRADEELSATPVLEYLSRHGIHAELHAAAQDGVSIEEALEREAAAMKADWIVMGAYGHNRMREILFGGVTRYLLDGAKFPLFLAH